MEAALTLVKRLIVAVAAAISLAATTPAWASHPNQATSNFSVEQRRDIEAIVRAFLLNNPEVIAEADQKLELRQRPLEDCGEDGKVSWVYRHFPIDELRPKARKEARAAECASELGGNTAFWAHEDGVFDTAPANDGLDLALHPQFAQDIGLDRATFETSLEGDGRGGKYAAHIESNVHDATASGGIGTPYSLVIGHKGEVTPINGAQIYRKVKEIADTEIARE